MLRKNTEAGSTMIHHTTCTGTKEDRLRRGRSRNKGRQSKRGLPAMHVGNGNGNRSSAKCSSNSSSTDSNHRQGNRLSLCRGNTNGNNSNTIVNSNGRRKRRLTTSVAAAASLVAAGVLLSSNFSISSTHASVRTRRSLRSATEQVARHGSQPGSRQTLRPGNVDHSRALLLDGIFGRRGDSDGNIEKEQEEATEPNPEQQNQIDTDFHSSSSQTESESEVPDAISEPSEQPPPQDGDEGRLQQQAAPELEPGQEPSPVVDNTGVPDHMGKNLASVSIEHHRDRGTPFFWHISKSGGTTVKDLYTACYRMIEASEVGESKNKKDEARAAMGLPPMPAVVVPPSDSDRNVAAVADPPPGEDPSAQTQDSQQLITDDVNTLEVIDLNGARYVNVDMSVYPGILKAKELGLAESRMSDVIFSPLINEAANEIFLPHAPGKLFTVFRDPIERVISLFYYLQKATWEPTYNTDLLKMSLEEYAFSPLVESNFMVRTLAGKPTGPLSPDDIQIAKNVISQKCLVGLIDHFEESMDRFDKYFGFGPVEGIADPVEAQQCRETLLNRGGSNINIYKERPDLADGPGIKEIHRKNWADIILYDFIKKIWESQAEWFLDDKNDKENVPTTAGKAAEKRRRASINSGSIIPYDDANHYSRLITFGEGNWIGDRRRRHVDYGQ